MQKKKGHNNSQDKHFWVPLLKPVARSSSSHDHWGQLYKWVNHHCHLIKMFNCREEINKLTAWYKKMMGVTFNVPIKSQQTYVFLCTIKFILNINLTVFKCILNHTFMCISQRRVCFLELKLHCSLWCQTSRCRHFSCFSERDF